MTAMVSQEKVRCEAAYRNGLRSGKPPVGTGGRSGFPLTFILPLGSFLVKQF